MRGERMGKESVCKGAAEGCTCPMRLWEDSILFGFDLHS